jgi:large subunit ribosomal protein L9
MEIILKEDIIGLGFKNDIVNVKSGYGRNYLIPQGKGVIASPMAKKILAENLKQQAHKLAAQKAAAEEKAAVLNGVALEIAAKVSATGQLYGSVGAAQVAEALAKLGKEVDRKIITMKDAKKLGEYVALVHYHKEVIVEIPVTVVAENAAELKAAAEAEQAIRAAADAKAAAAAAAEAEEAADEEEVLEALGAAEEAAPAEEAPAEA